MAEQNPEALKLIEKMIVKFRGNAVNILLLLDDMNIRGNQICYAINSICKGNLDLFFQKLTCDPTLVTKINEISYKAYYPERARFAENHYILKE